ncbi:hypothetical protein CYY_007719 [Polysphondylium violaceum]|uniref:Cytochrome c oxidase assembly protein COX20, mitochondrial n=1 Tax=Polysphondylium violaceum TaxID=133409 RepID=A0A8J4PRI1_9MYCE|nr:hypothetical protein CYY_007719 [Polysphondylium violaceum]
MSDNERNKETLENNSNIHMYNLQDQPKEEEESKGFFGKDVSKIPCFKPSMMYGIGAGISVAFLSTLFSSKGAVKSADFGVITFLLVAGGYWPICNYNFNLQNQKIKMVMDAQIAELNRKTQLELEKQKGASLDNSSLNNILKDSLQDLKSDLKSNNSNNNNNESK